MAKLSESSSFETRRLLDELKEVEQEGSLQDASQRCASTFYEAFKETVALVRVYVTVPFSRLPAFDKDFVTGLAQAKQVASGLTDRTIVLSLLGTAGVEPDWNDRRSSKGHLGIPLVSAAFIDQVPMVSRLMSDMGLGLEWIDKQDTSIVTKALGRMARVFYVADAQTSLDDRERHIVPAQDFVKQHGIKTVFGVCGSYPTGSIAVLIVFTRESLDRNTIEGFMPLISVFKTATMAMHTPEKLYA